MFVVVFVQICRFAKGTQVIIQANISSSLVGLLCSMQDLLLRPPHVGWRWYASGSIVALGVAHLVGGFPRTSKKDGDRSEVGGGSLWHIDL